MASAALNTETVINSLPGIFYVFDTNGRFLLWNTNFEMVTGYSAAEIQQLHPLDFFEGEDKEHIEERIRQAMTTGHAVADAHLVTKDGSRILFHFTGFRSSLEGEPCLMGMGINMEEKHQAETALQQVQQNYEQLFSQSPLPQWLLDAENYCILQVNKAAVEHYGYSEEEFRNMSVLQILTDAEAARIQEDIGSFPHTTRPFLSRWKHRKKNGEELQAEVTSIQVRYNGRDALLCVINDVTEKLALQEQLTSSVIKAQERERAQLGRELHDNVNQILTTVKLYNELFLTGTQSDHSLLEKSMHYLQVCIDEIRSISKRLSAPALGKIHIEDSLRDLIESINMAKKVNVEFIVRGLSQTTVPADLHLTVYRIVQEQLNNIIKHAEASRVQIQLSCRENWLYLTIADDGKGFNKAEKREGIGLANMESRTENMKGKLLIQTAPGKGCRLTARFPLHA